MMFQIINFIAQRAPWEDPPAPKPMPQSPPRMSMDDFQRGIQQWNDGATDNTQRDGLLIVAAVVLLAVIVINLRQKWKNRATEDSEKRLARELAKVISFPMGSRMMLRWVARATHVSLPALLLSSQLFDNTVNAWAEEPTYVVIRRWGYGRLMKLRETIFEPEG